MFDLKSVGELKRAELDQLITNYSKANSGVLLPPEGVTGYANKSEVAVAIEEAAELTGGFPLELTEDMIIANELYATEGLVAGDMIIVPWPNEEEGAREVMLEQLADLLADLDPKVQDMYNERIMEDPTTEELAAMINEIIEVKEQAAPAATPDAAQGSVNPENVKDDAEDQEEDESFLVSDLAINDAVKAGTLVYENQTIIQVRPKIASGRLMYILDAQNGASYQAGKEDLLAAMRNAVTK